MAIEVKDFKTKYGDTYEKAYSRIVSVNINYVENYADVCIGTYRSEEDRSIGSIVVELETQRVIGDNFDEWFKELSIDKIDATINPLADVYNDLTQKEGKYKDGLKLYDEKEKEGVIKEISKEEFLKL